MGWAGPVATRLLADLGATVLKVEAGRYPDWWRGMNWSADIIQQQLYEKAMGFTALNRGKLGVSLDLTTPAGRQLAIDMVKNADAVVENQAAGIMDRLGLGYRQFADGNPDVVMISMSAFGLGNDWSDTRAYGSTLEQGSGLPTFTGNAGTVPTMAHLAYGDPVGGLYGCAALLTAMVQKERGGGGQFLNASMVDAMLQFTTPGLIEHQLSPGDARRGNAHAAMAPHGIFPAEGVDQWVAVSVEDNHAFASLTALLDRPDWANDPALQTLAGRKHREVELHIGLASWTRRHGAAEAAALLQQAGVAAAPVLRVEELQDNDHFTSAKFFSVLHREISGPQVQMGVPIKPSHERVRLRRPAPLLGEHSREVLECFAGVHEEQYKQLVEQGVVSFIPRPSKNLL